MQVITFAIILYYVSCICLKREVHLKLRSGSYVTEKQSFQGLMISVGKQIHIWVKTNSK